MTPHIQTLGGTMIPLDNPQPRHIFLPEIAHALARIPRFNGHTLQPWSVADHSLLVLSRMPAEATPELRLADLLHDAHEAYLGDITTPVATAIRRGQDGCAIEGLKIIFNVAIAGALHFDAALFHHATVLRADTEALAIERHHLMATPTKPWPDAPPMPEDAPHPAMARYQGTRTQFLETTAELLLLHCFGLQASRVVMEDSNA